MVLLRAKVSSIEENHLWRIASAGTWTENGLPIMEVVEHALESVGLTVNNHFSRMVTREILQSFQLVLVMEYNQKEALQIEFPDLASKIYMMGEMIWLYDDVPDPIDRTFQSVQLTIGLINYFIDAGWDRIYNLSREFIPIQPHPSTYNYLG